MWITSNLIFKSVSISLKSLKSNKPASKKCKHDEYALFSVYTENLAFQFHA